ncbi:MAG: hypothetical protein JO269_09715 [Burkholderiaceae bacterium]|nr:hypothetical protein [Burkholderiaceae bacterium]
MSDILAQMMADAGHQQAPQSASSLSIVDQMTHDSQAPIAAPQLSEGAAAKQRIIDAAQDFLHKPLVDQVGDVATGPAKLALNWASGIGSTIAGGFHGAGTLLTGGSLEDAANAVQDTQNKYTYQPTSDTAKIANEGIGGILGGAKQAMSTLGGGIGHVADMAVGNKVANVPGAVGPLENIGSSAGGVAPDLYMTLAPAVKILRAPTDFSLNPPNGSNVVAQKVEPTLQPSDAPVSPSVPDAVTSMANKPRLKLNTDGTVGMAAKFDQPSNPLPPMEAPVTIAQTGALPMNEQAVRFATLNKIGLDTNRPSNITGDKFQSGQDYQTSLLQNDSGKVMREQIAKEQAALNNYGDQIVQSTGGKLNSTPTDRGQAILQPLNGLSNWFDQNINNLYSEAKQRAATVGTAGAVNPQNLMSLLGNPEFRETLLSSTDGTALLGSVDRQVARFQGNSPDAMVAPSTVQSAENLRKYFNSVWKPQNSGTIGALKQALDMDVAQSAGQDVFKQARQLYALRANTLDNPNGMASILNESGPDGVNRKVPIENIATKITSLPDAQFGQIVNTLRGNMPKEIYPQAQNAINEIRAQLADQLVKAGRGSGGTQWNANAFHQELGRLQGKLGQVFNEPELENIKTLHDAGYIINTPKAYPGAAAQGYNFIQNGVLTGLPSIGGMVGSAIGGPVGTGLGIAAGGGAANIFKGRVEAGQATDLANTLSAPLSLPKPTMAAKIKNNVGVINGGIRKSAPYVGAATAANPESR